MPRNGPPKCSCNSCKYCKRLAQNRAWNIKNREHMLKLGRENDRLKLTGFTPEMFAARLAQQNGLCAICHTDSNVKFADWNRETKAPRGILCNRCTVFVSMLEGRNEFHSKALEYIKYHKENPSSKSAERDPPRPGDSVESKRAAVRKYRTGFSREHFEAKLVAQCGRCAICERGLTRPCADHCHTSELPRGVLCSRCNVLLGIVENTTEHSYRAREYLSRFS